MEDDKDKDLDVSVEKSGDATSVTITAPDDEPGSAKGTSPATPASPDASGSVKGKLHITVDGEAVNLGPHESVRSKTGEDVHVSVDSPDHLQILAGVGGAVAILFTLLVLPIWIIAHYRSKHPRLLPTRTAVTATGADLKRLASLAERLERRMDAMEALMDAENPNWRK